MSKGGAILDLPEEVSGRTENDLDLLACLPLKTRGHIMHCRLQVCCSRHGYFLRRTQLASVR